MRTPLEELRAIGLTIELDQAASRRLWGTLLEIDGVQHDSPISAHASLQLLRDLYDVIAAATVTAHTSDDTLETMIPNMVEAFHLARKWPSFHQREIVDAALHGSITRWKGKKLQMEGQEARPPSATALNINESTGAQINRLREECRWTVEKLAEMIGRDVTTTHRHISGLMTPSLKTLGAYERVFSKVLQKRILIRKTPPKRQ